MLLNYLPPRDIVNACAREQITRLACVPPLWVQLAQLNWPAEAAQACVISPTPAATCRRDTGRIASGIAERQTIPDVRPDRSVPLHLFATGPGRCAPDSMGKAIPERRNHGAARRRQPNAPHTNRANWFTAACMSRSATGTIPAKTAERFKPIQAASQTWSPEVAVWSGDTVRMDEEGYLYFISRRDEMIKTSGYRVSPTEVEEVIYATDRSANAAAFGVAHPQLGQAIVVSSAPRPANRLDGAILAHCKNNCHRSWLPHITSNAAAVCRAIPNGKIDRKLLAGELAQPFRASL